MKNNQKSLVILLILYLISYNHSTKSANSTLTIPPEFNLIAINGKALKSIRLQRNKKIKLLQGTNKLAMEYFANWKEKNNNLYSAIRSKIFIVGINLIDNQNYRLTYLKPANIIASRKYAISPYIKIVSPNNEALPINIYKPTLTQSSSIVQQTKISQSFKKMPKPIYIVSKKPLQDKSN